MLQRALPLDNLKVNGKLLKGHLGQDQGQQESMASGYSIGLTKLLKLLVSACMVSSMSPLEKQNRKPNLGFISGLRTGSVPYPST